ncbi:MULTISPECIES: hypothetical protein [unclassified Lentimonas]|uniref:hypothetical protein n=1 Tax=unclassified Lentimonas TaxID=2630993 RepID=UPI0013899C3F|nr:MULTISPECIES: hypothetical protein [unclassified Lentimonas]
MEKIDAEEGAKRMASFRAQRLEGDFCFKFQLEQKPRRGKTVRYDGVMYGSWNERGPVSRFQLFPEQIGKEAPVGLSAIELIVQNGVEPEVWIRRQSSEPFTLIEDGALFEPIFEGVLYTPFDLQMPFIFWEDYTYEGPSRVLSRIGQRFLMQPPEDSLAAQDGVSAVRIALDDAYYALLRVEVLGAGNVTRSRFTVISLKEVQGQYIVKEIELKNLETKDATDFNVKAASVGLIFDPAVFDPQGDVEAPAISAALFDAL